MRIPNLLEQLKREYLDWVDENRGNWYVGTESALLEWLSSASQSHSANDFVLIGNE